MEGIMNDIKYDYGESISSHDRSGVHSETLTRQSNVCEWKENQIQYISKIKNTALQFHIMHDKAYKKYWCLNVWFNIPIIILSTVTGSGNFASTNISKEYQTIVVCIIGLLNILNGIIATISTFIGSFQNAENHRVSSIAWYKLYTKISLELTKNDTDKQSYHDFSNEIFNEHDHILEISPSIPDDVRAWFMCVEYDDENNIYDYTKNGPCNKCIYFPCGCVTYKNKNKKKMNINV